MHIDELKAYLDEIDMDLLCLPNTSVSILLYANDADLLSKSRACSQRLFNKLFEFFIFFGFSCHIFLEQNYDLQLKQKEIQPRGICLCKDSIELTHEYKCLGVDFFPHLLGVIKKKLNELQE